MGQLITNCWFTWPNNVVPNCYWTRYIFASSQIRKFNPIRNTYTKLQFCKLYADWTCTSLILCRNSPSPQKCTSVDMLGKILGISSCSILNLHFWYLAGLLHCGTPCFTDFYYKSQLAFEFAATLSNLNNMHVEKLNWATVFSCILSRILFYHFILFTFYSLLLLSSSCLRCFIVLNVLYSIHNQLERNASTKVSHCPVMWKWLHPLHRNGR